ncbi:MAG: RlmE family RNA methyltransferase [Deltaproteobacteria bacterium]|nr:RlmE family RNA methyltransferase [Deltaproteobacteria bacterium]
MGRPHQWHDHYTIRARREGFPARSVYKLEEIQKRFRILKPGARVLDLGCAPGSWLLFASKAVGGKGLVVGVDRAPISVEIPSNVRFIRQDILARDESFVSATGTGFEVVLSDLAPSTTGSKFVDSQRSLELSEAALAISARVLNPGGSFLCKIFQGPGFKEFSDRTKKMFDRVWHVRPKSTRKGSREIYVVGLGKI